MFELFCFFQDDFYGNIVSQLELQKFNGADLDGRIKKVTEKMQEIGI